MVGSSDSIGSPTTTINAIVAEAFCEAADRLEAAGEENFDMAVHDLIKEYMTAHQRILFNGDGYSKGMGERGAAPRPSGIPGYDRFGGGTDDR